MNADTGTSTVTIPKLEREDTITIDLVVSDGQTESNKASAVIDIQHIEQMEDAIEQHLPPADNKGGTGWSDTACENIGDIADCLSDGSDSTFVSSDGPSTSALQLFSFPQFGDALTADNNSSNIKIAYVTAQV
jgi:hypothetical protein